MANYFEATEKNDLLSTFMTKLVKEILTETGKDDRDLTDEERQELGTTVTAEWTTGKTADEISDILIEKFGSEEDKADYAAWKI
jgi:hypothetical protein